MFQSIEEKLIADTIRQSPNETGGVLVGTRNCKDTILEYNILGILCITDVKQLECSVSSSSVEFICNDKKSWAKLALKAVELYGMNYIGDWHSHPNMLAFLSATDIKMLKQQYILNQFCGFPPLHVIIGLSEASHHEATITANVMLNNKLITVVNPEII